MSEPTPIRWHEDLDAFRDLLTLTAARTGFLPRLVEKDYFCSVLLQYLAARCPRSVFKGGTCLAKVHTEFHRLSEDLDFTLPIGTDAPRSARSRLARELKHAMAELEGGALPEFRIAEALRGANNSTQYRALVAYTSRLTREEETIQIEAGLREPVLTPVVQGQARTLLLGASGDTALVPALSLACLSYDEAMAEKVRAALTRRDPAIRDFYDIDRAVRRHSDRLTERAFLSLVRRKLEVPGNLAADLSSARFEALEPQLDTALKPVLRPSDFASFDLERAFSTVSVLADRLGVIP